MQHDGAVNLVQEKAPVHSELKSGPRWVYCNLIQNSLEILPRFQKPSVNSYAEQLYKDIQLYEDTQKLLNEFEMRFQSTQRGRL